jgi:soluble lytic murein transglycosylase-like protein
MASTPFSTPSGTTSADQVFQALVQQESGGRTGVRGRQTAYGVPLGRTQMLPETAREMAAKLGVPWRLDLLTANTEQAKRYQNVLGRAYFNQGLSETGNYRDALHYYHGGPNRKLWGPKTQRYASEVLARLGDNDGRTPRNR